MSIDEAIKHAEEVAEQNEWFEENYLENKGCKECAKEHRQLAEWLKDYKRLLEQEPCDDAISREDAEQMFRNIRSHLKPQDYKSAEEFNTRDLMLLNAEQMIHALPSVTQKSGKWIYKEITDDYRVTGQCSECKERRIIDNYCPNCGARMVSE